VAQRRHHERERLRFQPRKLPRIADARVAHTAAAAAAGQLGWGEPRRRRKPEEADAEQVESEAESTGFAFVDLQVWLLLIRLVRLIMFRLVSAGFSLFFFTEHCSTNRNLLKFYQPNWTIGESTVPFLAHACAPRTHSNDTMFVIRARPRFAMGSLPELDWRICIYLCGADQSANVA
jgi:hypothetical protein